MSTNNWKNWKLNWDELIKDSSSLIYNAVKMIKLGQKAWREMVGIIIQNEPSAKVMTFSPSCMPSQRLLRGAIKVLIIALPARDRQQHRHLPE